MEKHIGIEGMSCNHCTARVEKALKALVGVTHVEVLLDQKKAIVVMDTNIENQVLMDAIDDAGYDVTGIE